MPPTPVPRPLRELLCELLCEHTSLCVTSQGEEQKKLDVISNDIFCNCLRMSGRTGVIASEEEATPVAVEETDSGNYIVVFDPLDGSSNIDAGEHVMGWLLSAVFESLLLMLWNYRCKTKQGHTVQPSQPYRGCGCGTLRASGGHSQQSYAGCAGRADAAKGNTAMHACEPLGNSRRGYAWLSANRSNVLCNSFTSHHPNYPTLLWPRPDLLLPLPAASAPPPHPQASVSAPSSVSTSPMRAALWMMSWTHPWRPA